MVERAAGDDIRDGVVADGVREAVGAQEVAVTGADVAEHQGGLHGPACQRFQDEGALRVVGDVLGRQLAFVDKRLDVGVVFGDLL